jgi:AraC-like DNA-binding protein
VEGPDAFSVTRRPAPALGPLVDHYDGYRLAGFPPGWHRGAPARHMTFIVAIGPEIDVVRQTDARQPPRRYRAVLSGLQASAALIAHDGYQEGVSIALSPLGCRTLFGLPARALWDTSLELDEVVGAAGRELAERLQEAPTWPERFEACDEVLGRLLRRQMGPSTVERTPDPALGAAWDLLVASGGGAPVADVARAVGWTRQHLRSRFVDELGLSPKLAGRIRFERARRLLLSGSSGGTAPTPGTGPGRIAEVAAACGYYDQAHLTREFVELVGCPPGRLLAEELPSVQDEPPGEGAP